MTTEVQIKPLSKREDFFGKVFTPVKSAEDDTLFTLSPGGQPYTFQKGGSVGRFRHLLCLTTGERVSVEMVRHPHPGQLDRVRPWGIV